MPCPLLCPYNAPTKTQKDCKFIARVLYNKIMSKLTRLVLMFVLLFSLFAAAGQGVAHAQGGSTSQFFPETGHNVSGEFWKYYQSVPNARDVFGYPLTEAFTDAKSGRLIQYFTRARFELHTEYTPAQVFLSPLGSLIYVPGQGVDMFTPIGCRAFSNGYSVCFTFLDFFDQNGGEAVFGKPISTFQFVNGRIVQYFERARFDWYPEYGEGKKVVLADLGRIYFDVAKEDPNLLLPVQHNGLVDVLTLHTRAFVWKAVTQTTDQQVVYVVVQDQNLSPVLNASVTVTVYWANGSPNSITRATDQNGVVLIPFTVQNQGYGSLVTVGVQVLYGGPGGLVDNTITSFRVWQ